MRAMLAMGRYRSCSTKEATRNVKVELGCKRTVVSPACVSSSSTPESLIIGKTSVRLSIIREKQRRIEGASTLLTRLLLCLLTCSRISSYSSPGGPLVSSAPSTIICWVGLGLGSAMLLVVRRSFLIGCLLVSLSGILFQASKKEG